MKVSFNLSLEGLNWLISKKSFSHREKSGEGDIFYPVMQPSDAGVRVSARNDDLRGFYFDTLGATAPHLSGFGFNFKPQTPDFKLALRPFAKLLSLPTVALCEGGSPIRALPITGYRLPGFSPRHRVPASPCQRHIPKSPSTPLIHLGKSVT